MEIGRDFARFFWPKSNVAKIMRIGAVLVIVVGGLRFLGAPAPEEAAATITPLPLVEVSSVAQLQNSDIATLIGTVRAVNEAQIQAESSGRVTSVRVSAGDTVSAGTIIATLENSSQQAAVLQAQGSYEAALASAATSEVSVDDARNSLTAARNSAINTLRSSFTTTQGVLFNTVDDYFTNPLAFVPGVRIDAGNQTTFLNTTRTSLNTSMAAWQTSLNSLNADTDLTTPISTARTEVTTLINILDTLIPLTANADSDETLDGVAVKSLTASLTAERSVLVGILASLDTATTNLTGAKDAVRRAEIGSTQNSTASASDAQIKQALGSLRAAQASLEKTILRAPIAGVVITLSVNTGDFVSAFTPLAEIASSGALEVSTFVGESDLALLRVGEAVRLNSVATGTIVNIAPAIDSQTFKTEVKIAVTAGDLTNGDTVTITLTSSNATTQVISRLFVPITAVKFNQTEGTMFAVVDGTLSALPVEVGEVRGNQVEIISGIDSTTQFVVDVRGKSADQEVEVMETK